VTILDAALEYVDDGDLGSLSARALAAELGVTPMALYRHFAGMDEIVSGMVGVLVSRLDVPERHRDWRSWLAGQARPLRRLLVEQPVAVAVFARAPVTTPAARARLEAAVDVLVEAGFEPDDAVRAYAAVHTYTVGFCALEASRSSTRRTRAHEPTPDADVDTDTDEAARLIGAFVSEDQFEHGLHALLRGLSPDRPADRDARRRR
jgi:AcrR family transcriptional regulator